MTRAFLCLLFLALAAPVLAKPKPSAEAAPAPAGPPPPAGPTDADWRTPDPQNVVVIDTNKGRIFVEMSPDAAPAHVQRIRELTRAGFYDGKTFFRVLEGFMDQTGDPKNDGTGQSDKPNLDPEFTFRRGPETPLAVVDRQNGIEAGFLGALPVQSQTMDLGVLTADHKVKAAGLFCPGVAGMARAEDPASANSQFFLMRGSAPTLNGQYTAWGRAIAGLDVIRAIKTGPAPSGSVADPRDQMVKVQLLADMPAAGRPSIRVLDARGPWMKVLVDRARVRQVVGFTICDVDIPSEVK